ncbi:MAG TPA: hypothetical protein VFE63_15785, partial [Roseiarcus sp.]|nr:hypothetical protein [Roseiarcus sp.]
RLLSAAMLQAPHPAIWIHAMRTNPDQRQRGRYVQILRLPWLSEMTLRLGNYQLWRGRSEARPAATPSRPRFSKSIAKPGVSRAPSPAC